MIKYKEYEILNENEKTRINNKKRRKKVNFTRKKRTKRKSIKWFKK